MRIPVIALLIVIANLSLALAALSGCGQKRDLYLPPSETPAPANSGTAAERPEPADQDSERDPVNVDRPPL